MRRSATWCGRVRLPCAPCGRHASNCPASCCARVTLQPTGLDPDAPTLAGRAALSQAAHHLVLEDCIAAVEAATARRDRLEAQYRGGAAGLVPGTGGAGVAGPARHGAGRGGDTGRRTWRHHPLRQSTAADGLSRAGPVRAFERRDPAPGRDHQGREWRGTPHADRGGLELPLPGPDQPRACCCARRAWPSRSATPPGRRRTGCVGATASSPGPGSRRTSSPPRSPANWRASSGPSPDRPSPLPPDISDPTAIVIQGGQSPTSIPSASWARLGARSRPGEPSHPLPAGLRSDAGC